MADADAEYHITAERSYWSGSITALCGFTAESGEYTSVYFGLSFLPRCQTCQRLKNAGT
ncbi:MAG: hypothetical protein QOI21_30 [Actinomycetota bacterium]|jgi:hypothetical protein|nr:hypothetical protein [Actinomycetota bacterium]